MAIKLFFNQRGMNLQNNRKKISLDSNQGGVSIVGSWIIGLLCLITSTGRFVMDSYLPSMPAMSQDLGVSGNSIELTLTWYVLGFGLSQLVYGPLSDKYGRKPILMAGFAVFLLANTFCALAQSLPILLIARLLSGIGIGASGVLNRAIASDCFSGQAFSKAWSYTVMTVVFVLMIAPLIGCEVQAFFGWRANFILTTFYVLAALIVVYWKLPETHLQREKEYSIKKVMKNYATILSTSSFLTGTLCYTLAFSGLVAYFQVSPLLLMQHLGLSSLEYGYTSLVIALSYLSGGMVVNRLVPMWGTHGLLKVGIVLMILSGVGMWVFNPESVAGILLPVCLYVIGARIVIPNAIANSFTGLRHLGGSTSGMIGFIQMAGSALVSGIVSCFNSESSMVLAILFTLLGIISLLIFFLPEMDKFLWYNSYSFKNLKTEYDENFSG